MKYELINPSDKIYYEAPDKIHSALATSLLSNSFGGKCLEDSKHDSPIFLFGGSQQWIEQESGITLAEFIRKNSESIYDTLKSFRYDGERTSMNKIVDFAHKYAQIIKEKWLEQSPSEQAVS